MIQGFNIEKIQSKTDLPTLKVNNFLLHSKYDPKKEAEQFVKSQYIENHVHLLFGFGLGYFAEALKKKINENDRLVIIDPLFKEIKSITNQGDYHMIVDVTEKNIEIELNNLLNDYNVNVKLICSPNYDKLFPDLYKLVLKTVKDVLSVNSVFFNTINYFAEIWQENYIRNYFYIFEDGSLSELEKRYNLPVVIASGGPSLTKQIPLLKKVRNNVLLIAAGSTVNTLLHYDIEADYVVSVDGSIANYNHFKDSIFQKSKLIYSVRNHYKIREQFKGPAFSFIPSFEPGVYEHIEKITGKQLPTLLGGASVANYTLTIAERISSGPIALIGQDLAYTENKTHAEHNKHFSNVNDKFKEERRTFFTEGYDGENVLTDAVFLSMKKGFEQIAEVSEEAKRFFNCTEGGVKIKGFRQKTFQEFCDDIESWKEKSRNNECIGPSVDINNWRDFYAKIQAEIKIYEEILHQLNKGLRHLKENPSKIMFSQKAIKGLNKVDKKLKELLNKVSMNSIVEPVTMDVLNKFLPKQGESKAEEYARVFKQNQVLYDRLLNATNLSRRYTENLLEQIKKTRHGDE
ncbi:motility associated factor glycosyltransferase family protein [Psychrobacillus sp. NPDC096389]|uniref:motility associated factor glycosyltransferase family protein n=1 Tax=Psychrobacillus sp. NPDC096389 TaxID=3364490 RepID=UPI0037FC286F